MNSEIFEHDGKLFVVDPWQNHFTQPIKYRNAWPTGISATQYPHLIGKRVKHCGGGIVRCVDDGLRISLEYGEETHCETYEERRIPRPPGKREYRNGRWCV